MLPRHTQPYSRRCPCGSRARPATGPARFAAPCDAIESPPTGAQGLGGAAPSLDRKDAAARRVTGLAAPPSLRAKLGASAAHHGSTAATPQYGAGIDGVLLRSKLNGRVLNPNRLDTRAVTQVWTPGLVMQLLRATRSLPHPTRSLASATASPW